MHTPSLHKQLFVGMSLLLLLALLFTACGNNTGSGSQTISQTPSTSQGATTSPVPATSPTPATGDTRPTSQPAGVKLGPQPCPAPANTLSYWDSTIGTTKGVNKVENVTCANVMNTSTLQALVTVRYSGVDERLDVYVYKNINNHPQQLFALHGLVKGDAKMSGYNTVMTAEADTNSSVNTGKPSASWTRDLFREFDWSANDGTLIQTAFPGIFPDLTRYQAEADQVKVNRDHGNWKYNAAQTAREMAQKFFSWKRPTTATIVTGGGAQDVSATVGVTETPLQGTRSGPTVNVTLSRLEGNIHNIWMVIGVEDGSQISLNSIPARSLVSSPVKVEGVGAAFEAVIGHAVVYDHLYNDIGHAAITSSNGMGKSPYSTSVIYNSSFHKGIQEGIVAVYEANGGISDEISGAVMRKVMLDPVQRTTVGTLPCPDAVRDPAHWTPLLPTPHPDVVAESVSCGNLLGTPTLQALVTAREIVGGGPTFRSIFVFDTITSAHPTLLFKLGHLYKGDARISAYSTITTAEADLNSTANKGQPDAKITPDLSREFKWSPDAGKFVQVAFPGIFPDLTRYQATMDQMRINSGSDAWKNDAVKTAQKLVVQFLKWTPNAQAKILSGGGPKDINAVVQVHTPYRSDSTIKVILSRLEGNARNMWTVTGVQSDLTISSPVQRDYLSSPFTMKGTGSAFEGQIGQAFVLDHLYNTIGQARVTAANGVNSPYITVMHYDSTFRGGAQEGVIALYSYSAADGSIAGATMVKEMLSA